MEKVSVVLMGIAMFLCPIWLILSQVFEKDSIYPQKRDWFIGALGVLVIGSFILAVVFGLLA